MRFARYRTPATDAGDIDFPLLECWNPVTEVATIAAEVSKRRVSCRISFKILQERFDASAEELGKGYGGRTIVVLETAALNELDHIRILPGDFAVTAPAPPDRTGQNCGPESAP